MQLHPDDVAVVQSQRSPEVVEDVIKEVSGANGTATNWKRDWGPPGRSIDGNQSDARRANSFQAALCLPSLVANPR